MNIGIGELIAQVRRLRGITQAELARLLHTSQSAINRIEHGKQNLSLKTLGRISKALDYELISLNHVGQPKVKISKAQNSQKLVIELKD